MKKFWQQQRWPIIGVVLFQLITTIPYFSRQPFNWDAAQFELGVRHFSLHMHQPHPPGYPLYIALGKLVALAVSPRAALVMITIMIASCAVLGMYYVVWRWYGQRWLAVIVTLLFATNPLFWLYRVVPLTYVVDAAVTIWLSIFTLASFHTLQQQQRDHYGYAAAILLGIASGFRPSLVVLFLPVLAIHWWRMRRWQSISVSLVMMVALVLVWLIPLLLLSGGPAAYWIDSIEQYRSAAETTSIVAGASWSANWETIVTLGQSLLAVGNVLWLVVGVMAVSKIYQLAHTKRWPDWRYVIFGVAWIMPSLLVYGLIHFGQIGYLLTIIPSLYLPVAAGLYWCSQHARRWWYGVGVMVGLAWLVQASIFLWLVPAYTHPAYLPQRRIDIALQKLARQLPMLFKLNASYIQQTDDRLTTLQEVVQSYDPATTVILAGRNVTYPAAGNGLPVRNDEVFRELSAIVPMSHLIEVSPNRQYYLEAQQYQLTWHNTTTITVPSSTRHVIIMLQTIPPQQLPQGILLERRSANYGQTYYVGVMTGPFSLFNYTVTYEP
ncbi:MAG: DUF2723 domain-containing protein [Candidatus Kerfeldbacteria bacterium]|nr:DUF2723 domain-containing protein [Candidatus Kerfeldbacteria bacterium]